MVLFVASTGVGKTYPGLDLLEQEYLSHFDFIVIIWSFAIVTNSILHCCSLNIRRQAKVLYIWYPKKQGDWDTIHKENNVIKMREELVSVKKKTKQGKHTCLVMRMEHPRDYEIVFR